MAHGEPEALVVAVERDETLAGAGERRHVGGTEEGEHADLHVLGEIAELQRNHRLHF